MNRRAFIASAGATCLASTLPLRGQSSGPDQNILNSAIAGHALSCAESWTGSYGADQWTNLGNIHASMLEDCLAKSLDGPFKAAVQNASVSQINSAYINQQQATSAIQAYQPAFTLAALQQYYALCPQTSEAISTALTNLQSTGLSPFLEATVTRCRLMAVYAQESSAAIEEKPHLVRARFLVPPHPTKPPCKPGTKCDPSGGYNCQTDGAALLGLGTTMVVIAVLAAPEVGILAAAFWGPMSFWGGVGVGAWTAGHAVHCGF